MKKSFMIFMMLFLAYTTSAMPIISDPGSEDGSILQLKNYVTYYGSARLDEIKEFDLAFLESNNYNSLEIASIKEATIPVCYVTIGEDDVLHVGDGQGPGGYASWYLDADNNNKPDQNPYWKSYYVNASNPLWQAHILNELTPVMLYEKGCYGLFLDTIDTIELYPSTTDGMISLIRQLREKYPDNILVANRGFTIAWEIAPYINGIMFESFSSSLANNRYLAWAGDDLDWTSSFGLVLRELQETYPIKVFALDYADSNDQTLINYDYNRALDYGFIPYASTINLDEIYFHSYTRQKSTTPDGFTDPIGDVRRSQIDIVAVNVLSDASSITLTQSLAGSYSSRAYYGILLDTDFSYRTGYKSYALGADYLIENNMLYSYFGDGSSWSWQSIKPVTFTTLAKGVSWIVDYPSINSGLGRQLAFIFYAGMAIEQDTTVRGRITTFQLPIATTSTSTTSSIETTSTINATTTTSTDTTSSSIPTTTPTSTTTTTSTTLPIFMIPAIAFDRYELEQISPDSGSLDGTVDLSNNDARWLTNDGDYINVTDWDATIPLGATITNVKATCEVDFANTDGGYLFFARNAGFGWNWLCQQVVTTGGNYECELYASGVDTPGEVNNLDLSCIMVDRLGPGAPGFSIDHINVRVDYT